MVFLAFGVLFGLYPLAAFLHAPSDMPKVIVALPFYLLLGVRAPSARGDLSSLGARHATRVWQGKWISLRISPVPVCRPVMSIAVAPRI